MSKRIHLLFTGLAAGLLSPTAPLHADALNRSVVAGDAQWVAHLDVEAMRHSTLGRAVFEAGEPVGEQDVDDPVVKLRMNLEIDSDQVNDMCEALEAQIHLDLRSDIKSATLYGVGDPENPANVAAVFSMTAAVDQLAEKVRTEAPEYRTLQAGGYHVESFRGEDGKTVFFHLRQGIGADDRIVLLSGDSERLVRSIAVVEGKLPSLSAQDAPALAAAPQPGSFFFAASSTLDWVKQNDDPGSAIVRRSQGLRFDIGEAADTMFIDAQLSAANAEDAANLADVLQGLAAMARLAAGNDAELAPFRDIVRSFNVSQQENAIIVKMRHPTDRLVNALSTAAQLDRRRKSVRDEKE